MKKLLITALAGTLTLTACGTDTHKSEPTPTAHSKQHKGHHHHAHMDKKGHGYEGTHPHFYQCVNDKNDKAILIAHPDTDSDVMTIEITAPALSLNKQNIELKIAPSASGERYINDKNPASIYEWHTKGHFGIFGVNVNGVDYEYRCNISKSKKH